jgi:putative transposase
MEALVSRGKKHSKMELAAKLAEADELASQGKLQSEIAKALGVSVMTLYRWRNAATADERMQIAANQTEDFRHELGKSQGLYDLQNENSRLRRLIIDLLLEKMKLEDAITSKPPAKTRRSSVALLR